MIDESVNEERSALDPPDADAGLPLVLWLIKYSQPLYLAQHNVSSIMPAHIIEHMPVEAVDRIREKNQMQLQMHLWGKRSIIGIREEWDVRRQGEQDPVWRFQSFGEARFSLRNRELHMYSMDVCMKIIATSMPMRPDPMGLIP